MGQMACCFEHGALMGMDPVSEMTHCHGAVEEEILRIVNQVRTDPKSMVTALEERKTRFQDMVYKVEGRPDFLTHEGAKGIEECIQYLKSDKTNRLDPLEFRNGLCMAAAEHAEDLGTSGDTGHTGFDGSTIQSRIERYGDWGEAFGANNCLGESEPLEIVLSLLIDDGNKSRGHRKNLMNPMFKTIGLGLGPHTKFGDVCVMNFAAEYGPKVEKLTEPLRVTVNKERNPEMLDLTEKILQSIPFSDMSQKVRTSLKDPTVTVILDYKPGAIEIQITQAGITKTQSGTWEIQKQKL